MTNKKVMEFHRLFPSLLPVIITNVITYLLQDPGSHLWNSGCCCFGYYYICNYIFLTDKPSSQDFFLLVAIQVKITNIITYLSSTQTKVRQLHGIVPAVAVQGLLTNVITYLLQSQTLWKSPWLILYVNYIITYLLQCNLKNGTIKESSWLLAT